jgi:hypothetical protein
MGRGHPSTRLAAFFAPARWPQVAIGALAIAWLALWCNNIGFLPILEGFDITDHLEYLQYILQRHSLPLANEGFEMYQPPLYYLLSAGQLALFHSTPYDPNGIFVLRLFGMGCGIAAFIFVFLSLRLLFPKHPERQFFGLLLAALLPANLYLYHYVTNEILALTLVAAATYLCLRTLASERVSLAQHAILGVVLGAALLAKSSTIVAPPLILVALAWNLHRKKVCSLGTRAGCLGVTVLACVMVSGWHYGRVAAHFGNLLIGNWDPGSGFSWWQQPGYRTTSYYVPTGQSLAHPLFSGFANFADGTYSTLWGDGLCGGSAGTEPATAMGLRIDGRRLCFCVAAHAGHSQRRGHCPRPVPS